jgi:hypothetical protein
VEEITSTVEEAAILIITIQGEVVTILQEEIPIILVVLMAISLLLQISPTHNVHHVKYVVK